MLHVVRQVQRHFPGHEARVVHVLAAASAAGLAMGIGLLMLG